MRIDASMEVAALVGAVAAALAAAALVVAMLADPGGFRTASFGCAGASGLVCMFFTGWANALRVVVYGRQSD